MIFLREKLSQEDVNEKGLNSILPIKIKVRKRKNNKNIIHEDYEIMNNDVLKDVNRLFNNVEDM